MGEYSEQDLQYAAEFRDGVHREALEKLRKTHPEITAVIDPYPLDAYFQEHWDYPGKWYTVVAIPKDSGSREKLIDAIVKNTLERRRASAESRGQGQPEAKRIDAKHYDYERLFTVSVDQRTRRVVMAGRDARGRYILENYEEYSRGSATGSVSEYYVLTEEEYLRYAREALLNGCVTQAEYEKLTGKGHKTDFVVYQDERYTLGQKEDWLYLLADGKRYWLSCSPYEPCLYISDECGDKTAVHYAFDPRDVFRSLRRGETVTSITGREYDAPDFCRLVEYAAGMGNISMGDAERVFEFLPREIKAPAERPLAVQSAEGIAALPLEPEEPVEPFYALIAEYPDCVLEYYLAEEDLPRYRGCEAHRQILTRACGRLLASGGWRYDVNRARGRRTDAKALFSTTEPKEGLSYRKAFLCPPQGNDYSDADFDRVNAALFPRGTEKLEVYEWTTDWSDYFHEGHEWWGALCLTVYDKAVGRYVVILASATD